MLILYINMYIYIFLLKYRGNFAMLFVFAYDYIYYIYAVGGEIRCAVQCAARRIHYTIAAYYCMYTFGTYTCTFLL